MAVELTPTQCICFLIDCQPTSALHISPPHPRATILILAACHPRRPSTFSMPRNSERQGLLNALEEGWIGVQLLDYVADIDLPDLGESLEVILLAVLSNRYLQPRSRIPKAPLPYEWILHEMDQCEFRQQFRLHRASFDQLLGLVEGHSVFQSPRGKCPQAPVAVQLLVALCRFGTMGNGGAVNRIASALSIAGTYMH